MKLISTHTQTHKVNSLNIYIIHIYTYGEKRNYAFGQQNHVISNSEWMFEKKKKKMRHCINEIN